MFAGQICRHGVHIPSPFISNGHDLVASEQLTLAVNFKSEESRCSKTANERLEVGNDSVGARNKNFLQCTLTYLLQCTLFTMLTSFYLHAICSTLPSIKGKKLEP